VSTESDCSKRIRRVGLPSPHLEFTMATFEAYGAAILDTTYLVSCSRGFPGQRPDYSAQMPERPAISIVRSKPPLKFISGPPFFSAPGPPRHGIQCDGGLRLTLPILNAMGQPRLGEFLQPSVRGDGSFDSWP